MLLLRSVSLYDVDRDVWVTPRGDIPTEILKNATGYVQLHDDHIRYCQSMKSIVGSDLTIIVILQVPSALLCVHLSHITVLWWQNLSDHLGRHPFYFINISFHTTVLIMTSVINYCHQPRPLYFTEVCFYHNFFSPPNLRGLWASRQQTLSKVVRWWW